MLPLAPRKPKPLSHQFEDDLGALVDQYLRDGIDIEALKGVLRYEADFDHDIRKSDLMREHPPHVRAPISPDASTPSQRLPE